MIDWTSNQTRLELKEIQTAVEMYGRGCRVVQGAFRYRKLRNYLWWKVRRQFLSFFHKAPPKDNRLHIYFYLRGGLGDCAVYRPVLLALRHQLPNAVFYYYTDAPHAAELLFEPDEKNVFLTGSIPLWYRYDWAVEICVSFKTVHFNRARFEQLAPHFIPILETSLARQNELSFFLQDNYFMDDMLGRFLNRHHASRLEAVRYLSALDFDVNQTGTLPESILHRDISTYGLKSPYITLHSGINTTFDTQGRVPLKCWPEEKWREFVKLFKAKFPHIQVVQLGGKNSPKFDFVDVCLVGKSSVQDLPALLAGSLAHVDGESGLVQLTRWLPTRAVVLFGPTSPSLFALSKNVNLTSDKCGSCMWLQGPSWHTDCTLGYPACQNMLSHTPEQVLQAVTSLVETNK
ncbi:MAG: glycosyltransferase family 9 protein [Elusimicrobiaceae bacterium]|nr:glycosyltransferase family 9 protein [Elusimicrobiaceae bacterium]